MIVMFLFIFWSKMEPFLIVLALWPLNIMIVYNANIMVIITIPHSSLFSRTLICSLYYLLHYLSCSLTCHSQLNTMQTSLWHHPWLLTFYLWLCLFCHTSFGWTFPTWVSFLNYVACLVLNPKRLHYYNLIFKYLCISHHVEFWNPTCLLSMEFQPIFL